MIWTAIAPEIQIPRIDMQPVAAFIREAPVGDVVSRFRNLTTETEASIALSRLQLSKQASHIIGRLSGARLDGWSIDCSKLLSIFENSHRDSLLAQSNINQKITSFTKYVVALHLQGSHTIGTFAMRFSQALKGWSNDLEDFKSDIADLQREMERNRANAPVTRAIEAYSNAVEQLTGYRDTAIARIDPEDFEAMAFVNFPVADDVRADRVKKRFITRQLHDHVSKIDDNLVGIVAVRYISTSVTA